MMLPVAALPLSSIWTVEGESFWLVRLDSSVLKTEAEQKIIDAANARDIARGDFEDEAPF